MRAAVELPVGWGLLLAVTALARVAGDGALSPAEVTLALRAWRQVESHCQGGALTTTADLDRLLRAERPETAVAREPLQTAGREAAVALQVSLRQGSRLVGLARAAADLPAASDALTEGRMTQQQLQALVAVTRELSPHHRSEVETEAVRRAQPVLPGWEHLPEHQR